MYVVISLWIVSLDQLYILYVVISLWIVGSLTRSVVHTVWLEILTGNKFDELAFDKFSFDEMI